MAQLVICPSCKKTVVFDEANSCSECGQPLDIAQIKKLSLTIDRAVEAREFAAGKDYFINTEFLSASEHFKKALDANKNSYLSQYFILICDIYLKESSGDCDVMARVMKAISEPLELMQRANVTVNDRLNFISAILAETKIIIIKRLNSHDELFDLDISKYRKNILGELQTLLALFKIDGELLMTYSPSVRSALLEIADTAIALCHKAVQTVAVGEELYSPSDYEYNRFVSLNNDYCFFASSLEPEYDVKKYTPDLTQNNLLNDKVLSRFIKFDAKNKSNAKKHIIGDIDEYNDILEECEKALTFTYRSCFMSLCDAQFPKRKQLLKEGLMFLYRLLTPRIFINDKKRPEMQVSKFVDISERCVTLTKILGEVDVSDTYARDSLRSFYERICDIMDIYFVDEFSHYTKIVNKLKETKSDDFERYERFLYDSACAAAPALVEYTSFNAYKDKSRMKLVKYCKQAAEEFLMLRDYHIDEIDQSNIYRPILDIYSAVMKEIDV